MAFTNEEIIKLAGNVLAAGVIDAAGNSWYETLNPNSFITDPESIWSDMTSLKGLPADNFNQAVQNSVNNPDLIGRYGIDDDGTFNDTTALRLTPVAGTNNTTYICYNAFGDPSGGVQKNWIQPQLIPRSNGFPSSAYSPVIFSGLPSGGNRILTSSGNDGNWVSHFWNPAGGLLLISTDEAPPSAVFPSQDLYLCGFFYNGQTGGAGGSSGSSILLEDPNGRWRITAEDGAHLHFQRWDLEGGVPQWNTHFKIGASATTDGINLTKPYAINADLNLNSLEDGGDPILRPIFSVKDLDENFVYGNSDHTTVLETAKGKEVERAVTVINQQEFENRPLFDEDIVLDTTDTPEPDSVTEISWHSDINYSTDASHIRFNEIAFDVVESSDDVNGVPIRISVERQDGELVQENISLASLQAGVNGGFNFKTGYNFYTINPKYSDVRTARNITRLQLPIGYKVKLKGGTYTFFNTQTNQMENQFVPRQKSKVEYVNYVNVLDGSNVKEEVYKDSNVVLDHGVGSWYPTETTQFTSLASPSEHSDISRAVLGNYNSKTYVASGNEGLHILFQDDSTRRQFWTEPSVERRNAGDVPLQTKTISRLEIDVENLFASELQETIWDVVNIEKILPLFRYEGDTPISYRVSIESANSVGNFLLQENQTRYALLNKKGDTRFVINPANNPTDPDYHELRLPRETLTVDNFTKKKIVFEFHEPIKVYGNYINVTDPLDPEGTGTFIPSIKATVVRVFERPIVTGDDLEQRVDEIEGQQEWAYATQHNWPTIHEIPTDMWLADGDGEPIFWAEESGLAADQDEHQWLFDTGMEAYYQPLITQGTVANNNITLNPLVVHVPYDSVKEFSVVFGWDNSLNDDPLIETASFTFYIATHGRNADTQISIQVPKGASLIYNFTKRRNGRYGYRATPFNDNLASTSQVGDLSDTYPADPNPPI